MLNKGLDSLQLVFGRSMIAMRTAVQNCPVQQSDVRLVEMVLTKPATGKDSLPDMILSSCIKLILDMNKVDAGFR